METGYGFDLERFVSAQDGALVFSTYELALAEIVTGRKQTHWIWYVFPCHVGLAKSHLARVYGVTGIEEASAYLAHPILGARLVQISKALLALTDTGALEVFGRIDCAKVQACMTLFGRVEGGDPVFRAVLDAFFDGEEDQRTVALIDGAV